MKNPSHKNFMCIDCGKDTWDEYYMLYSKVWKKVNPQMTGKLCILCVEKRLGRKLNKNDFTKVEVNTDDSKRTTILKKRLIN